MNKIYETPKSKDKVQKINDIEEALLNDGNLGNILSIIVENGILTIK